MQMRWRSYLIVIFNENVKFRKADSCLSFIQFLQSFNEKL